MNNRKKIILFNGHDFRFIQPIINHFSSHTQYEILLDDHPGHIIVNTERSTELLNKSDIIFCEWCLGNAEWYSINKKPNQILIIRLHHQELNLEYSEKIYWENVDKIIFICQNNMKIFLSQFPKLLNKAILIYNPINTIKFRQSKINGSEFNIGLVGFLPMRKAPDLAVSIFEQLKHLDHRYKLFLKGKLPWEFDWLWDRQDEKEYYERLFNKIEIYKERGDLYVEPYGDDIQYWFSKIGLIFSTSEHEGSHQVVAEGMASGAIPVIRDWEGADLIYPPKYIFHSPSEAIKLVTRWKQGSDLKDEIEIVKNYSFENFDQSFIIQQYEDLFLELVKEKLDIHISPGSMNKSPLVKKKPLEKFLKILMICYINPGSKDGYATRVIEEARVLNNNEVRVILVCFIHKEFFKQIERVNEHLTYLQRSTGAYVHLRPSSDFFDLYKVVNGSDEIENEIIELAEFYNVQIIYGESIYSTIYALRASRKSHRKLIFDVHGIAPEESEMNKEHSERTEALKKVEEQIIKSSDMIVFVSHEMKKHYQKKYNLQLESSIIIPTCVENRKFIMSFDDRRIMRKSLGLTDKFVFLYLGSLSVWQWPEAMFNLFVQINKRILNSFFYLLIPEEEHIRVREIIEEKGIANGKFIIDHVDHGQVGSIISVADAGLLLRKSHPVNSVSYPTKAGEYFAAGVPIITTKNVGDVSQAVQDHNLGVILSPDDEGVSPEDEERINDFVLDVETNRERWFGRCRKFAHEYLDWTLYGDELLKAFSTVESIPK